MGASFAVLGLIQALNKSCFMAIAIINNLLFSIFFQAISGTLRFYLNIYTSDPNLFVIDFEILIRYVIVTNYYPFFKITTYSTMLIICYSWISMSIYHKFHPNTCIGITYSYSKSYEE